MPAGFPVSSGEPQPVNVWITAALGHQNRFVIATAAFMGIPTYTTSLTALPAISGLLTQGMIPAAARAFLVARRVFVLYISFALPGAILIGYMYQLAGMVYP